MSDTLMTIIGIFIAVILMFIFPLVMIAGKSDEMAQTVTEVAVADFVETVTTQGKITEFDYNQLVQKLYSTGNTYDIQIEAQILDDNPRRATTTSSSSLVGEYKYYSVYTNTILDKIQKSENQEYLLKKDDYVIVTVKNTNITLGTQFKNILYNLIGKDTYTIGASSTGLVINKANYEQNITGDWEYPEEEIPAKNDIKIAVTTKKLAIENVDIIFILDSSSSMTLYNGVQILQQSCYDVLDAIVDAEESRNFYIGVIKFDEEAEKIGSITSASGLPGLKNKIANGFTANANTLYNKGFELAMKICDEELNERTNRRCIIFMIDGTPGGGQYTPDEGSGYEEAKLLKSQYGVDKIYTIQFRDDSPYTYLKDIADLFGTEVLHAEDSNLTQKFKEIFYEINTSNDPDKETKNGLLDISDMEVSAEKPMIIRIIDNGGNIIKTITITEYPTSSEGVVILSSGKMYLSVDGLENATGLTDFSNVKVNIEYYSNT